MSESSDDDEEESEDESQSPNSSPKKYGNKGKNGEKDVILS